MNVLMIVSWYSDHNAETMSAGVFHYEQSMALKKYCNVALYYPYDTNLKKDFFVSTEKGLLTFRHKRESNRIKKYCNLILDYLKIKKEFKPDIIHAHVAGQAGMAGVFLGKLFRIPVIVTEHLPIEMAALDNPRVKRNTNYVFHNSRANICVSPNSMNRLKEFFPDENFKVIYNGVIKPRLNSNNDTIYAREKHINCCIVAAFYNKDVKGYQYLLPAIQKLVHENIPIVLHICGGGEFLNYYKQMAMELGLQNNCIFYGQCNREKVYQILDQMDFSISASLFESAGVSVQEAMLLGKPVLVTKSGGANSLVTEDTAIVVEKGSSESLVNGIKQMIKNLSKFDSKKIHEYAYKNFEIDEVSKQYFSLYNEVLKNNRA